MTHTEFAHFCHWADRKVNTFALFSDAFRTNAVIDPSYCLDRAIG